MMKFVLLVSLVILALAKAHEVCNVYRGKTLHTFGGTREQMKLPCKYNAIRRTICGRYMITLTPGNALDWDRYKYFVRSMWVGVKDMVTDLSWEGRTTHTIAAKFLDGRKDAPFNKKDGHLETTDLFDFEYGPYYVSLVEKTGQFRIDFGVYDQGGRRAKTSGFNFECYADPFMPTDYPDQLCGNGTRNEVFQNKKDNGFKGNRMATMFMNIFTNDGIVQTDSDCKSAARAMTNQCQGQDEQYNAAMLCWPLVGKSRFFRSIINHFYEPASAFRHCVEFVCSGFTDLDACAALGYELNDGPTLPGVSNKIVEVCYDLLDTTDDLDPDDLP